MSLSTKVTATVAANILPACAHHGGCQKNIWCEQHTVFYYPIRYIILCVWLLLSLEMVWNLSLSAQTGPYQSGYGRYGVLD